MSDVTVEIVRDPEAREFWLARFSFGDRTFTTQGRSVSEARRMAGELLRAEGAGRGHHVTIVVHDDATVAQLLDRSAKLGTSERQGPSRWRK
ncbi:MAG: hypothetical protein ABSD03_02775 [Vulcanimicrobiaceae bacterium]|jgi:hypothetical protein